MLPAWAEPGGTTIVVVPLVALRHDLMQRCQRLDIPCIEWNGNRPGLADGAAVVLVTPESAVTETFLGFVNRKRLRRELDRVVIDECHVVLNKQHGFREATAQLGQLALGEAQMVLLSATLPPEEEAELCRRMHFERAQVQWLRASTVRTNIAYRVVHIGGRDTQRVVVEWLRQRVERCAPGKVVVYGNSVPQVMAIAEELRCHAYHSKAADKAGMLDAFRRGAHRVIAATGALGMGVDIPDIRCVVHVGRPRTLLDYAQESGRAGRDGESSEAFMLLDASGRGWGDPPMGDGTRRERELVSEYIDSGCRRKVLDAYLDGASERERCEEHEAACDHCRRQRHEVPVQPTAEEREAEVARHIFRQQLADRRRPAERLSQQRVSVYRELDSIRQQLAGWAGRCLVCWVLQSERPELDYGHPASECPQPESQQVHEWAATIGNAVRLQSRTTLRMPDQRQHNQRPGKDVGYERYAACFWCGVPQSICAAWVPNNQGAGYRSSQSRCQFHPSLVISMLAQLVRGPMRRAIWPAWRQRLAEREDGSVNVDDVPRLVRHLQRRFGNGGEERSGAAVEMIWAYEWVARQMDDSHN
jgi:superfamily II DNA helicase RecQ